MGLFSAPAPVNPKLSSVLIGGTPADLKKVSKAQDAILGALKPQEQLIFVVASTNKGDVWAFTDQRLLEAQGKISYDLSLSKIAETKVQYKNDAEPSRRLLLLFRLLARRPSPLPVGLHERQWLSDA